MSPKESTRGQQSRLNESSFVMAEVYNTRLNKKTNVGITTDKIIKSNRQYQLHENAS